MYMNSMLLVVKRLKAHQIIFDPNVFASSQNVVLGLVKIFDQINRVILDNLFTIPELILQLKDQGIFAVGTLRQDGSRGCEIPTEKEMRKSCYRAINQFTEKSGLVFCV